MTLHRVVYDQSYFGSCHPWMDCGVAGMEGTTYGLGMEMCNMYATMHYALDTILAHHEYVQSG